MRTLMLMLVPGLALLACQQGPALPSGEPARAVEQFYAAVAAGSCQDALAELGAAYRAKIEAAGCEVLLESMREFPLDRILETTPDGRAPEARLVRARIHNRTNDVIIRVEPENGRWMITSM